jgi:hypothetical protein
MKQREYNYFTASSENIDAAKKLADTVNSYAVAYPASQLAHMWLAIRLADGSYDGTIYQTRRDAVRHQSDEKLCAYISLANAPGGMTVRDAFEFLAYHRAAYDAGFRLPDPDDQNGGMDLCAPIDRRDVRTHISQMLAFARGAKGYKG